MKSWTAFCATIAITAGAMIVAAVTAGNYLPGPIGRFIPWVNIYMRLDLVADNAVGQGPGCILVIGDSRTALNINASQFSSPACEARNYGFPAFSLAHITHLLSTSAKQDRLAEVMVIVVSEIMMNDGAMRWRPWDDLLGLNGWVAFRDGLLTFRPLRRAYIGAVRMGRILQYITDPAATPPTSLMWSKELSRWQYGETEQRVLTKLPSLSHEIDDMARDYYEHLTFGDVQKELVDFVAAMAGVAQRFVIVLPPAFPALQEAAERISPGKLSSFLVGVRAAAAQRNLPLIDCSTAGSCGVSEDGFADPVHLNASGAAAFSAALAQRLSALVSAN
jgi:hypothetical protein